jgi:hypothetical protein
MVDDYFKKMTKSLTMLSLRPSFPSMPLRIAVRLFTSDVQCLFNHKISQQCLFECVTTDNLTDNRWDHHYHLFQW